jgi:hypothetical protein
MQGGPPNFTGGLAIYDVSVPSTPKLNAKQETDGAGVHRHDFEGAVHTCRRP